MTTLQPSTAEPAFSVESADRALIRNAGALFGGQLVALVVPLLTVPYLARVLGPGSWGPVIAAQALANWLVLILEFGFDLSGTRAVARARAEPGGIADIVNGVQSAKALLSLAILPVVAVAYLLVPAFRAEPALLLWAAAFAILRGFSPLWYFQGIERVHGAVAVDTAARSAAALAVFVAVRAPEHGWRVIALQAGFSGASVLVLTTWLGKHVSLRLPQARVGVRTLREGGIVFACRASSGLYIQANALILSVLAAPAIVAFFGGAERIIRAAINLFNPLTQAFLPRISYLHATNDSSTRRMVRRSLLGMGALGLAMGLTALIGAPLLVRLMLGPQYTAAVPVLRVMSILPILVGVNTVLGLFWALPFGRERLMLVSILAAGVTNIVLALVLVPRFGAIGMALSAAGAEVAILSVLAPHFVRSAR